MMSFGLSDTGFSLKRLEDILADSRALAATIFQDLLTPDDIVDTSDSSTLGRLINLVAPSEAELWEQSQLSYSAMDPNTATGIALDNIVQYQGLGRLTASYSNVTGLFKGENGITIPIGSIVGANTHPNTFATTSSVLLTPIAASGIDVSVNTVASATNFTVTYSLSSVSTNTVTFTSDGSATEQEILDGLSAEILSAHPLLVATVVDLSLQIKKADAFATSTFSVSSNLTIDNISKLGNLKAEAIGDKAAEANSLSVIKTPVLGWDTITNPLAATEGRLAETDEELRLRFRDTKFERSSNILDSMYSALVNLDGVESVAVYENDTDIIDSNLLPPHSFTAVVLGADSEDVAKTIWVNKPTGITSNGNTSVEIIDSQDFPRIIKFERPAPVVIYIDIALSTDALFPADGEDQIRSAIISYASTQFSVGDDVIYSRLYTPINSIAGHQVNSLTIGITPTPVGVLNIPIAFDEISSFESININITTG
jgi:uncharacterized phage protein gp47/JayE